MNPSVNIRQLKEDDFAGVKNIDVLTQKDYLGQAWEKMSKAEQENILITKKSEFKQNCETGFSFVAEMNNKIVGFIFSHETLPFSDKIHVRHIAINPNYQAKGIGKKLYETLINKAKKAGKKEIIATINPDNPPSIKLHEQLGFEVKDWKVATFFIQMAF